MEHKQSNCSKHKKEICGISDMKDLANRIGDLHYETLGELLKELYMKLKIDSDNDKRGNRIQLARHLKSASISIHHAWQISKPFMKVPD